MRYTVYNKAMKRPVFQTNDLEEAIDYTRRHPRKSRRHCIYDDKLKTFDIKKGKSESQIQIRYVDICISFVCEI